MSKKVAIVTGGTSGIGRATALALQEHGYTVYELSRRAEGMPDIRHIVADITKEETLQAAVEQVLAVAGRLDLVVNNAGFGISGAIEFTDTQETQRLFDTLFFGMVRMNRCVIPLMRQQGRGRIVNISSVAAPVPIPFQAYYSAGKAAINAYTMALANELRPFGIRSLTATISIRAASAAPSSGWSTTSRPAWIPPRWAATSPPWPAGRAVITPCMPPASTINSSYF